MNGFPRLRRITALLGVVLLLTILSACDFAELPHELDKNTLCELAIAVVNDISAGDFEKAASRLPVGSIITADDMEAECKERLSELGTFDTYRLVQAVGTTMDGTPCATVILNCAYADGLAVYTMLFDTSYRLLEIHLQ